MIFKLDKGKACNCNDVMSTIGYKRCLLENIFQFRVNHPQQFYIKKTLTLVLYLILVTFENRIILLKTNK